MSPPVSAPGPSERYDAQLVELAEIIRGERPNPYPSSHELILQEALLAASGIDSEENANR